LVKNTEENNIGSEVHESVKKSQDIKSSKNNIFSWVEGKVRQQKIVTIEDENRDTINNKLHRYEEDKEDQWEFTFSFKNTKLVKEYQENKLFKFSNKFNEEPKDNIKVYKEQLDKRKEIIFQSISESMKSVTPKVNPDSKNTKVSFNSKSYFLICLEDN